MGILTSLFEQRGSLATPEKWIVDWIGGPSSATGIQVTAEVARRSTAVWAAVKILSETIASLPLKIYRRLPGGGKEPDPKHPLYSVLHDRPNRWQTSFEWREMMVGHLALRGNAYSEIIPAGGQAVAELVPLHPDRIRLERELFKDQLVYRYQPLTGQSRVIFQSEMLHLRGLSDDGRLGLSPISEAREAIGLSLATEEYGARLFSNDARPGGVLQHPKVLGEKAAMALEASWHKAHGGLKGAHRVAVLEEGMSWKQIGMTSEDAQFLETRKFQIAEIARIFHIPPHMLGDLERATFSNVEQMSLEFVVYTLMPWLVKQEQRFSTDLMTPASRLTHFVEHVVDGLLRGDLKSRYESYAIGRNWGWLSVNAILRLENMNPIGKEGDVHLQPLNMVSVEEAARMTLRERLALLRSRDDTEDDEGLGNRLRLFDGDRERREAAFAKASTLRSSATAEDGSAAERENPPSRSTLRRAKEGRSISLRQRLRASHRRLFAEAGGRIVRKEVAAVGRAAKKFLPPSPSVATAEDGSAGAGGVRTTEEFTAWLEDFYRDHPGFVAKAMLPILMTYAEAFQAIVAEEVGAAAGMTPELERFVGDYAATLGERHTISSRQQLAAILRETDPAEQAEAVAARLDEWEEKRADKMASKEVVKAGEAVAAVTYKAAGVTVFTWSASGDACPLCSELDGQTVGVDQTFVAEGDEVKGDGSVAPLTVSGPVMHPPLHDGCVCSITAG